MRVLIGCEKSQIVCQAFRNKGHEAFSCDIEPGRINSEWHLQGNVIDYLKFNWDLAIFHPPCTYLSYVASDYFNIEKYGQKALTRWNNRFEACNFFLKLWSANIDKICIENPRGFIQHVVKHNQYIHPWYFGDNEKKLTVLWLKNLPKLEYNLNYDLFNDSIPGTEPKPRFIDKSGQKRNWLDCQYGKDRKSKRSQTFPGIAKAMADQWG